MPRTEKLVRLLAKYGINPCNDSSCIFGSAGGMQTNGGCRCYGRAGSAVFDRMLIQRTAAALREACA